MAADHGEWCPSADACIAACDPCPPVVTGTNKAPVAPTPAVGSGFVLVVVAKRFAFKCMPGQHRTPLWRS